MLLALCMWEMCKSMFACVCVCACVRACMRACMHACMHACVHACVRACMHACVCVCNNVLLLNAIIMYANLVENLIKSGRKSYKIIAIQPAFPQQLT